MSNTLSPFEMVPFHAPGGGAQQEMRGRGHAMAAHPLRSAAGHQMAAGRLHTASQSAGGRMHSALQGGAGRMQAATKPGAARQQGGPPFGRRAWPGPGGSAAGTFDQAAGAGAEPSSERIRWVQFTLNGLLGANLPTDGIVTPDLRAAVRDFQSQQGLPVSGYVGPDTIDALRNAASQPGSEFEVENQSAAGGVAGAPAAEAALADPHAAQPIGSVLNNLPNTPVPGLYRLFNPDGSSHTGMALDLRRRIRHHVICARHLGVSLHHRQVALYPLPHATAPELRALEAALNQHIQQPGAGMLAHARAAREHAGLA